MTAQETAILEAFPGDDPLHRSVRIALLQCLHAGQWLELSIPDIAYYIQRMIEDPPWSVWFGPDEVLQTAANLDNLAAQLRRAHAALNAAKPHWQTLAPSAEAPDVIGIRPDRPEPTNAEQDECPF